MKDLQWKIKRLKDIVATHSEKIVKECMVGQTEENFVGMENTEIPWVEPIENTPTPDEQRNSSPKSSTQPEIEVDVVPQSKTIGRKCRVLSPAEKRRRERFRRIIGACENDAPHVVIPTKIQKPTPEVIVPKPVPEPTLVFPKDNAVIIDPVSTVNRTSPPVGNDDALQKPVKVLVPPEPVPKSDSETEISELSRESFEKAHVPTTDQVEKTVEAVMGEMIIRVEDLLETSSSPTSPNNSVEPHVQEILGKDSVPTDEQSKDNVVQGPGIVEKIIPEPKPHVNRKDPVIDVQKTDPIPPVKEFLGTKSSSDNDFAEEFQTVGMLNSQANEIIVFDGASYIEHEPLMIGDDFGWNAVQELPSIASGKSKVASNNHPFTFWQCSDFKTRNNDPLLPQKNQTRSYYAAAARVTNTTSNSNSYRCAHTWKTQLDRALACDYRLPVHASSKTFFDS